MFEDLGQVQPGVSGEGGLRDLTILAVDHGEERIGLAIKPAGQMTALPMMIIAGQPVDSALESIRNTIDSRGVEIVIIGLPVHENPTQERRVKRFARRLRQGVRGVRWRFADESLTSSEASGLARRAGRRSGEAIDDLAAALILETYIQSQK